MFRPQNKGCWPGVKNPGNGDRSVMKGKNAVTYGGSMVDGRGVGCGDAEVWQRFKDEGLLDEASLEKKDREALVEKIMKLENELYDYQYNMGLLLIEKQTRASEYEKLRQALSEADLSLKREQTAHLIALYEVEKREENLRKALGIEKQCVSDLEKALHEMYAGSGETKQTVDIKMDASDDNHAEVSRIGSDMERKFKEVEVRESALRSARQSLNAEREMLELALCKQREELQRWEQMLQDREEKQIYSLRMLSQKEEEANGKDMLSVLKDTDLKEAQKNIEVATITLEKKQDDINIRLARLAKKEEEISAMERKLEMKKDMLASGDRGKARDSMEIEKLNQDYSSMISSRRYEFEMDYELKTRAIAVEQKEMEIIHKEQKIGKREQSLKRKLEKCKEKEKELESKSNALRDKGRSITAEVKILEVEKKQMVTDRENLQSFNYRLVKEMADVEGKQLQLNKEKELVLTERENLKQDREKFEKKWEILDEKKGKIEKELNQLNEEREKFELWKHSEEEKFKNEKMATQDYIQKELEAFKLKKESVIACMEQDQSALLEEAQNGHDRILQDLELQKRELEVDMQNLRDIVENDICEKERVFENEKDKELKKINYMREVVVRQNEEVNMEKIKINDEIQKLSVDKKNLEAQAIEVTKGIDKLDILIQKLKDQHEKLKIFVERLRSCNSCGEIISEFEFSDLQFCQEMSEADVISRLAKDYLKGSIAGTPLVASKRQNEEVTTHGAGLGSISSGGNISWLRKCTSKILKISPLKRTDNAVSQGVPEEPTVPITQVNVNAEGTCATENKADPHLDLNNSVREFDGEPIPLADEDYAGGNIEEVIDGTQQSELKRRRGNPGAKRRPRVTRARFAKTVIDDDDVLFREFSFEHNEDEQANGNKEDYIAFDAEKAGDYALNDKGTSAGRKRSHAHASRASTSDQDGDNSEAYSDCATGGGRRKRLQTVVLALETPVGKRYNLRPKSVDKAAAAQTPYVRNKGKKKVASGRKTAIDPESESGKIVPLMHEATLTSIVEVDEFPSEKSVRFGTATEIDGATFSATNLHDGELSEGGNETMEGVEYFYDDGSDLSGDFMYEDEEDDDYEYDHPGEPSIGKKLWTFFTT